MAKQIDEKVAHHQPSIAEIRQKRLALFERQRTLQDEGAKNYAARKGSAPPPLQFSDHDRRVNAHVQLLMNGSTPEHLLVPAVSRDDQIRAELDAIAFVDRELGRQQEDALIREAHAWVGANKEQWRVLCHSIVIAAVRLASLEQRARDQLALMPKYPVRGLAMSSSIASGVSCLGSGDPLLDLRTSALNEGLVTLREIAAAMDEG